MIIRPETNKAVLKAQNERRKPGVAILIVNTVAESMRETVTRVVAFAASIASERRVARRFDSYRPKSEKMVCQTSSITVKIRKFHSLTFMERNSRKGTPPALGGTAIVASPKDTTTMPKSSSFKAFTRSRRFTSFMNLLFSEARWIYWKCAVVGKSLCEGMIPVDAAQCRILCGS